MGPRRRTPILVSILVLVSVVAACQGPRGPAGARPGTGPGPGTVDTDTDTDTDGGNGKIDPAVLAYEGPRVDLQGVSLTATTSEPEALNMGALFAFDKLRQWGAKVDQVTLTTTSGIQTMIAGRSDLASHGADEVVLGRAQGAKVTAIGSDRTKQVYVLVAKDSIDGVADLKGHTMGTSGPSGFDTLLSKYALRGADLKSSDARLAQIGGSPDRGAALIAGTVDAATIFESDWENVKQKAKDLHVIEDFARTTGFPGDAYYMKADYLKKHPKLALGIACANLEANHWINSHPQAFVDFTRRHVKNVDPASLRVLWKKSQAYHYFPTSPTDVISPEGLAELRQAMLESGDVPAGASIAGAVDPSYLQKASTMGCGRP